MKTLKQKLHEVCLNSVNDRIAVLQAAIHSAQASANEETKSSSGDKYETGRAMAQLEIEKLSGQLAEASRLKNIISQISPDIASADARTGSLVFTSRGNFYIAINSGEHQIDGQTFFSVSAASPIAQKLLGLTDGDTFTLNGKEFTILQIQ